MDLYDNSDHYVVGTHQELKDRLSRYGIAIVPCILNTSECDEFMDGIWRNFGHVTGDWEHPITKDDPSSWNQIGFFNCNKKMIYHHYSVAQAQFAWNLREHPRCVQVFETLLNVNGPQDLLVSMDGVLLNCPFPKRSRGYFIKNKLIVTQPFTQSSDQPHQYLSLVATERIHPGDATVAFLEGSHLYHQAFGQQSRVTNIPRRGSNSKSSNKASKIHKENYALTEQDIMFFEQNACQLRRIQCPRGSMIVWDSRLVHSIVEPLKERPHEHFTAGMFLSYGLRRNASEEVIEQRIEAYLNQRTTTYSTSVCKMAKDRYGSAPYSSKHTYRSHGRAVLSDLGKRLVGFQDPLPNTVELNSMYCQLLAKLSAKEFMQKGSTTSMYSDDSDNDDGSVTTNTTAAASASAATQQQQQRRRGQTATTTTTRNVRQDDDPHSHPRFPYDYQPPSQDAVAAAAAADTSDSEQEEGLLPSQRPRCPTTLADATAAAAAAKRRQRQQQQRSATTAAAATTTTTITMPCDGICAFDDVLQSFESQPPLLHSQQQLPPQIQLPQDCQTVNTDDDDYMVYDDEEEDGEGVENDYVEDYGDYGDDEVVVDDEDAAAAAADADAAVIFCDPEQLNQIRSMMLAPAAPAAAAAAAATTSDTRNHDDNDAQESSEIMMTTTTTTTTNDNRVGNGNEDVDEDVYFDEEEEEEVAKTNVSNNNKKKKPKRRYEYNYNGYRFEYGDDDEDDENNHDNNNNNNEQDGHGNKPRSFSPELIRAQMEKMQQLQEETDDETVSSNKWKRAIGLIPSTTAASADCNSSIASNDDQNTADFAKMNTIMEGNEDDEDAEMADTTSSLGDEVEELEEIIVTAAAITTTTTTTMTTTTATAASQPPQPYFSSAASVSGSSITITPTAEQQQPIEDVPALPPPPPPTPLRMMHPSSPSSFVSSASYSSNISNKRLRPQYLEQIDEEEHSVTPEPAAAANITNTTTTATTAAAAAAVYRPHAKRIASMIQQYNQGNQQLCQIIFQHANQKTMLYHEQLQNREQFYLEQMARLQQLHNEEKLRMEQFHAELMQEQIQKTQQMMAELLQHNIESLYDGGSGSSSSSNHDDMNLLNVTHPTPHLSLPAVPTANKMMNNNAMIIPRLQQQQREC